MNWILDLSLLNGPFANGSLVLGAAALLYLLFSFLRHGSRWRWLIAPLSAVVAYGLARWACWAVIHLWYWWPEDLPADVSRNVALAVWVCFLAGTTALGGLAGRGTRARRNLGDRRARRTKPAGSMPASPMPASPMPVSATPANPTPAMSIMAESVRARSIRARSSAVVAAAVVLTVIGLQVNIGFGMYPTVRSLVQGPAALSQAAPPAAMLQADHRFMDSSVASRWNPAAAVTRVGGEVLSVPIPGTISGFKARNAVVYLPPAYFAKKRPVLPVLVMVSGQPGSPESWLRATDLVQQLDSFAAAHAGLAPLVVMPDPNGSQETNTMCMNSDLAQADSYMSQDVPAWILGHLDADANPAHWAVAGFSYGGTCALQMVTRHPDRFHTFAAISPEREPALTASRKVTIERAFHGDAAAFNSVIPMTLLGKNKYPHVQGLFSSGSSDPVYSANVNALQKAARRAGMKTRSESFPGGHSWAVASASMPSILGFVSARLGLL